jgi:hypothetical protein
MLLCLKLDEKNTPYSSRQTAPLFPSFLLTFKIYKMKKVEDIKMD